ncbi:MAG: hypothetical protein HC875_10530 [Anaerolineales bacterium]|nr:hypothetical protein [Anaerolineales bacterium]
MKILYFVLIFLALSLSAIPVFALPGEAETIQALDYVNEITDCSPRYYGGQYHNLCDISPALQQSIYECEARTQTSNLTGDLRCEINVRPGLYFMGSRVDICGAVAIDLNDSKLMTGAGVSPFLFNGYGLCLAQSRPSAGTSSIENFLLRRMVPSDTSSVTAVEIHAPIRMRRFSILGYTRGVVLTANGSPSLPEDRSLANSWIIQDGSIQSSGHSGIYIDGPDVNVGLLERVGSTSNCKQGTQMSLDLGLPCADVFDGSFLGITLVAVSTGYAKDTQTNEVFPGFVLGDSNNNRSVLLGGYIESGYGNGVFGSSNANVLGGIGGWTGAGNRLEGNRMSGLVLKGQDGLAEVKMGSLTGGGALSIVPLGDAGSYPLRLKWDVASSNFQFNVGNVSGGNAIHIGGKATSNLGLGLGSLILRPIGGSVPVIINNTSQQVSRQAYP